MKKALLAGMVLAAASVLPLSAATVPSAVPRHTLLYSSKLEEVSIGLIASGGKRSVELDSGSETILQAESGSFMIGYDFTSWLMGFTTLGAGRMKTNGDSSFAEQGFKGSVGLNANLWRTDITHPEFMEGTLSFKMLMEYKQMTSEGSRTDYEWNELTMAFPFNYEMFTGASEFNNQHIYSLSLYVGPCYSSVDGTLTSGGRDSDFSESDNIGVLTGADLYFSDNLALGCQFQLLEDTEVSLGLYYHF